MIEVPKNDTDKYRRIFRDFAKTDTMIYDHFKKVLEKKIENYGAQKMAAEVSKLKNLTSEKFNQCGCEEMIPELPDGGFSKRQNVPENLVPWHPPGLKITTFLTSVD